ncbi:unnamed protein product [Microthlaspi erraticum]|uniref:Uncharacterized protein n=1 Tax=Microthlaspi erraticum TaxID=1685480 RepID=A0A6D2ILP5_9BRAS|nr:unnamed protein product [Microthlaspi erraticum]
MVHRERKLRLLPMLTVKNELNLQTEETIGSMEEEEDKRKNQRRTEEEEESAKRRRYEEEETVASGEDIDLGFFCSPFVSTIPNQTEMIIEYS